MPKISTEINMADCKMQFVSTSGVRVYIMDTVCRFTSLAEKEAIDTSIVETYNSIIARNSAQHAEQEIT